MDPLSWFHSLVGSAALALIAPQAPTPSPDWQSSGKWERSGDALEFVATSHTFGGECARRPQSLAYFPMVTQGFHIVLSGGRSIAITGDPSFQKGSTLYNAVVIPCSIFAEGSPVTWRAVNLTHSLASIHSWPVIVDKLPVEAIMHSQMHTFSAGAILFAGLVCFLIFFANLPRATVLAFSFCALFVGSFFIFSSADGFGISIATFHLHRLHDAGLWIGTSFLWLLLYRLRYVPRAVFRALLVLVVMALLVIATARTLDESQVGSTIAFSGNLLCGLVAAAIQLSQLWRQGALRKQWMHAAPVLCLSASGINDILMNMGVVESVPTFAAGFLSSFVLVAMSANSDILATFRERDYLRKNLEKEVKEKTHDLAEKSVRLEQTVSDLRHAQAELVQSAKLASLGTLAAGLAHEINNALNFPLAASPKLIRILSESPLADGGREKALKIAAGMQDGLSLTRDIIKSLKTYSSGSARETEDVGILDVMHGIELLVRSQIREHVRLSVQIPADFFIRGSRAGFSQVFLNLIGNAADALIGVDGKDKAIEILAYTDSNGRPTIDVKDNGPGIPAAILDRVTDPFFTTKPEGKGTGLGLHIVAREIEAIGGSFKILSTVGVGTTVRMQFPGNATLAA